jgi:hypothetical protein
MFCYHAGHRTLIFLGLVVGTPQTQHISNSRSGE